MVELIGGGVGGAHDAFVPRVPEFVNPVLNLVVRHLRSSFLVELLRVRVSSEYHGANVLSFLFLGLSGATKSSDS